MGEVVTSLLSTTSPLPLHYLAPYPSLYSTHPLSHPYPHTLPYLSPSSAMARSSLPLLPQARFLSTVSTADLSSGSVCGAAAGTAGTAACTAMGTVRFEQLNTDQPTFFSII